MAIRGGSVGNATTLQNNIGANTTSFTITLAGAKKAGSSLILVVGNNSNTEPTISDNQGNTWTKVQNSQLQVTSLMNVAVYRCLNLATSTAPTVTVNAGTDSAACNLSEWLGLESVTGANNNGAANVSPNAVQVTMTPNFGHSLLIGAEFHDNASTDAAPVGGWTALQSSSVNATHALDCAYLALRGTPSGMTYGTSVGTPNWCAVEVEFRCLPWFHCVQSRAVSHRAAWI